ncbi:MAG: DUF2062 domain-containing protein [Methylococcales bacterium]
MPKKLIKKYMPDPEKLKQQKSLQFLGDRLHEPNLWHLNRRSVSLAFAIGLFAAWIPTPGQMAIAAVAAFYFRANLPISVALVWVTNPLTMPPMFYFAYIVGLQSLGQSLPGDDFEFSLESILSSLGEIGGPFLFGCLILGIISSIIGYFGIRLFWRYHVNSQWNRRKNR